ncbi:hypothetical protein ACHAPM_007520 [Fusarium culmorum]
MASNGTQGSDANQSTAHQSDKSVHQNVANFSGGNRGRGRGRGQGVFGAPRGPFTGDQNIPPASGSGAGGFAANQPNYNAATGSYYGSGMGQTQNYRGRSRSYGLGDSGHGRGSLGRGSHGGVSQSSVNNVPNLPRIVPNLPTTSWTNRDYSRAEGRRRNLERTITFTAEGRNEPAPKQAIEDVNDNNQLRAENELLSGQLERMRIERDAAANKLRENERIWLDSLKQAQDQLSKAHDKIHSLEREEARLESYQRGYQTDIQVTRPVSDKIERKLSEATNKLCAALGEISSLKMKIASLKRSQDRN